MAAVCGVTVLSALILIKEIALILDILAKLKPIAEVSTFTCIASQLFHVPAVILA